MQLTLQQLIKPRKRYRPSNGPLNQKGSVLKPLVLAALSNSESLSVTSKEISEATGITTKQVTNVFIKLRCAGVVIQSKKDVGNIKRYWIN